MMTASGTRYFSPTYFHAQGIAVQRWYAGRGWFTTGWIGAHPWAWHPAAYSAAAWTTAAWSTATAAAVGSWLGWSAAPAYYDYGDNVTYQDGSVYYGDQFEATAGDYYQTASNLAASGARTAPDDTDWLPLGIFAVVEGGQQKPSMSLQLAVNKQGILRGNAIDDVTQKMLPVQGAVDETTQCAAWTVGDNKSAVFETGVYNLTKQEATGLIHFGADRTEQILLVRLKQDQQPQSTN
jgi:hypothetical protein